MEALPNELILHILICLRTADLMPLSTISHRFHDLIVRILAHRLRLAASLHAHSLQLESHHPSQRLPPYPCVYLRTEGLDVGPYVDPMNCHSPGQCLRELRGLFSSFKPYTRQIEQINPMKHPAGDVPGSRTFKSAHDDPTRGTSPAGQAAQRTAGTPMGVMGSSSDESSAGGPSSSTTTATTTTPPHKRPDSQPTEPPERTLEPVIQDAHLEAGVRFTQLCVDTNVCIAGPKPGLYKGYQQVQNGVLRVFRDWLAERAAIEAGRRAATADDDDLDDGDDILNVDSAESHGKGKERDGSGSRTNVCSDKGVLWVGTTQSVGIRFGVRPPRWRPQHSPILVRADEELPVSYEIEYEELLVRTSDLLLAAEKADQKQQDASGKAIVIGAWA